jgi:tetratricopeptide (TPR) repeat protein
VSEFVERDPDVPGAFRFRHALIRDAAYEGLPYRRRRELHARVAEVMERRHGERADEVAEILALHYQRAERWPEAWRYAVEAGRRAAAKYANVEAAQFFEQALAVAESVRELQPAEIAPVREELGDVRMLAGAYEQAEASYEAARSSVNDPLERVRLMRKEAVARLRLGRYDAALERLTEALQEVEGTADASAQRARLLSWYALALQHQRRPSEAVEWCERVIAEAEGTDAEDAVAQAYFTLDWAHVMLGEREKAVNLGRAAEIYERLGQLDRLAWVLNNQGALAYMDGDWDDAVGRFERALATFRRVGDETNAATAARNVAEIRIDQGRAQEVEELLAAAVEAQRGAGNPLNVADVASLAGRLAARLGRFDEARTLLEEARAVYAAEADEVELLTTDTRLVESLVLEGSTEAALSLAGEALERAKAIPGVSVVVAELHRLRGLALIAGGDLSRARAALDESLRLAAQEGENFGNRNPDYEAALTLAALVRLHGLTGEPSDELAAQRDASFRRFGVVDVPEPPLPG